MTKKTTKKLFRFSVSLALTFIFSSSLLLGASYVSAECVYDTGEPAYANPDGSCPEHSSYVNNADSYKNNNQGYDSNSTTYTTKNGTNIDQGFNTYSPGTAGNQVQNSTTYSGGTGDNVSQKTTTYSVSGDSGVLNNISGVLARLGNLINLIIPFLVGLAVFIIIYGILGYISFSADEEKRKQAKDFILWGVIGVFLMLSVWGLVTILLNTFNLNNSNAIVTKTYPAFNNGEPTKNPSTVLELIDRMNSIGSRIIPFLIGIAVFIIILGIVGYVKDGSNEEKRAEGRMFVLWGVISVFLMLSVWGLVNILVNSFSLNNSIPSMPSLPRLQTITTPK